MYKSMMVPPDETADYLQHQAGRILHEHRLYPQVRLLHGAVAPALVRAARTQNCDLVVMSTHSTRRVIVTRSSIVLKP